MFQSLDFIAAALLALAATLAVRGTNTQAADAKRELLEYPNELVQSAARLWRPGPRFTWGRKRRTDIEAIERSIAALNDPEAKRAYATTARQFKLWNDLESAVALAFSGSWLAVASIIIDTIQAIK